MMFLYVGFQKRNSARACYSVGEGIIHKFVGYIMGRILVIIFLPVYFALSSGIALNTHYCCERVVAVSIAPFVEGCCPDEDEKRDQRPNSILPARCCFDELTMADSDDNTVPKLNHENHDDLGYLVNLSFDQACTPESGKSGSLHYRPPPDIGCNNRIFLVNCSLVLYA